MSDPAARKPISLPFDFQHVVHTNKEVYEKLQKADRQQSEAQSSAFGQASPPLLIENQSPHVSSEDLTADERPLNGSGGPGYFPTTPPPPPPRSQYRSRTSSTSEPAVGFRTSRSIENFSRPAQRSPKAQSPPYNRLSFNDPSLITEISEHSILDLDPSSNDARDASPNKPVFFSAQGPPLVGHAVTTNDESARVLKLKPLPPVQKPLPPLRDMDLPPLPEETESIGSHSPSPNNSRPSTARSSLKHARSSPSLLMSPDRSVLLQDSPPPTGKQRSSANEDPFPMAGTPLITASRPKTIENNDRISIGIFKPINVDSWEEDIDYCYEHAAEADCDFEWARRSQELSRSSETVTDIPRREHQTIVEEPQEEHPDIVIDAADTQSQVGREPLKLSGLQPIANDEALPPADLPDLDTHSAGSASTYKGALTPGLPYDDDPPLSALPMASPIERQHQPKIFTQEQLGDDVMHLYSGILTDSRENSDESFHMYSDLAPALPKVSFDSARRSQSSIIDKYNYPRDSFSLSQGISMLRSAHHRSTNSESSLPDLVHSLTNSRELNPEALHTSSARHSIISLTHFPSSSKLSHMSTPSLTSGPTNSTPGSSLREQVSVEEMQYSNKPSMETTTSQSATPVPGDFASTVARSSPPSSSSGAFPSIPEDGDLVTIQPGHSSVSQTNDRSSKMASGGPSVQSFAARMRSDSNTAVPSSPPPSSRLPSKRASSRASYSLFPSGTAGLRSPPMSPPLSPPVGNFF